MGDKTLQNRVLDLEQSMKLESLDSVRIGKLEQEVSLFNRNLIKAIECVKVVNNESISLKNLLFDTIKRIDILESKVFVKKNPVGRPPKNKQKQEQPAKDKDQKKQEQGLSEL